MQTLRHHQASKTKLVGQWLLTVMLCFISNIALSDESAKDHSATTNTITPDTTVSNTTLSNPIVIRLAVAANFKTTLQTLVDQFIMRRNAADKIDFRISSGSTGTLYAQIIHGAPFDIFFAADNARPAMLVEKKLTSGQKTAVYAQGQISLAFAKHTHLSRLNRNRFCEPLAHNNPNKYSAKKHDAPLTLAIANPRTAPYGLAAQTFIRQLPIDSATYRLVKGKNVMHAQQLLLNGNVDIAILARSQQYHPQMNDFQFCTIANTFHPSLEQSMVIIKQTKRSQRSEDIISALYHFVLSGEGKDIITRNGYLTH